MFKRREYSKAQVVSAAVDNGRAQDELRVLAQDAAAFICEIVDKARAVDQTLPRGYFVMRNEEELWLCQLERLDTQPRTQGNADFIIAKSVSGNIVFNDSRLFAQDVSGGLLNEIGHFLIERNRKIRSEVQAMQRASSDIKHLRKMLDDESVW